MQNKAIPWMRLVPAALYGSRRRLKEQSRVFQKIPKSSA